MKNCLRFFLLLAIAALVSGCESLLTGLATEPYDKAVRQGRMSPSEYRAMRDQIDRAATAQPPSR
jgi:hypothetical protein